MREWLKEYREKAKLTQAEVAERAGMSRTAYGNVETGFRGTTVDNAKRIADVLGFHWTLFFEDESHETKNRDIV